MNIDSLEAQALKLPLPERWQLVQSLLTSIQQETQNLPENQTHNSQPPFQTSSTDIPDSWITKLVGVIEVPEADITDQYIHFKGEILVKKVLFESDVIINESLKGLINLGDRFIPLI